MKLQLTERDMEVLRHCLLEVIDNPRHSKEVKKELDFLRFKLSQMEVATNGNN